MDRALSSRECIDLLKGNVKFYTYPDLQDCKNIDDLFSSGNRVLLLYMNSPTYGHYTCLTRRGRTIYFYDSYGYKPDMQFEYADPRYNYVKSPDLCRLLIQATLQKYKIDYSDHKMQKDDDNIATCGRHCVLRLLFDNLSNDEYFDMMEKARQNVKKDFDWLSVHLSSPELEKL